MGTTGTGKTSTLNIYTGNDLEVGEGAQSVTPKTVSIVDKIHEGGPKWIDNPGKIAWQNLTTFYKMMIVILYLYERLV